MKLTVTSEDKKRTKVAQPGWVTLEITGVKDELAKDRQSMNAVIDFLIVSSGTNEGIPIRYWVNEKFPAMHRSLIEALLGGSTSDDEATAFDFSPTLKGRKVLANVVNNKLDSGRIVNNVDEFKPL